MPLAFLMSAIVSGIALVVLVYMVLQGLRRQPIDMPCLDKIASYLFYAVIIDFALEALDFIHRLYAAEEEARILGHLITQKLFLSLIVLQILLGMIVPLALLAVTKARQFNDDLRKLLYFLSAILILLGIFAMRWNVVIGGQLFSKSFRGLMTYKMEIFGLEGFVTALGLLDLPFLILAVLIRLLRPRAPPNPRSPPLPERGRPLKARVDRDRRRWRATCRASPIRATPRAHRAGAPAPPAVGRTAASAPAGRR